MKKYSYYFKNDKKIDYIANNKIISFSENDEKNVLNQYKLDYLDSENKIIYPNKLNCNHKVYIRRQGYQSIDKFEPVLIVEYFDIIIFSKRRNLIEVDKLWLNSLNNRFVSFVKGNITKIGFESFFNEKNTNNSNIIETGIEKTTKKKYVVYNKFSNKFINYHSIQNYYEYGRQHPVTKLVNLSSIDNLGFVYGSESSSTIENRNLSFHGGKGISKLKAQMSAFGEAVERYSANTSDNMILETSQNLDTTNINYLEPNTLSENIISSNTLLEWIEGRDLLRNKITLIPANAVLFPYTGNIGYEFMPQSTTGLASGKILREAINHAIMEVLERNSYSLVHKSMLPTKDITIGSANFDVHIMKLIKNLKERNISVEATLLPENHDIFVVHVLLISNNYPKFTHGSGAGLDFETAFKRALTESIQMRTSQILIRDQKQIMVSSDNNVAYKWGIGDQKLVQPFRHNVEHEKITDIVLKNSHVLSLKEVITNLKTENFDIFYVDLTKIETKLNVVKVIIPGMQDIDPYNKMKTKRLLELGFKNHLPMYS
ncbi:hypothetical protein C122C_0067 [Leuconostoc gelidum subsp. gasicomitatum]|uniref:YcaO domain-containing protein n=1 Tax=Leuconostoc gasicomitatum TaxID=115778 RepID=A0ABM9V5F1_9LACO|nr:YcaO-like family protein [Leuconostoc gasicomitatum]CUW14494.1 hypothetical protein C122C_0067 [Leuconostoc gasicomitatum]